MTENSTEVPLSLQRWFIVHFAADILFAVPLFLFPESFLAFLGWKAVDPVASRMVAAALFGIGIESLLGRKAGRDSFRTMLGLKIIWSSAAVIGIGLGLIQGAFGSIPIGIILLFIFLAFNILWTYWRIRLR